MSRSHREFQPGSLLGLGPIFDPGDHEAARPEQVRGCGRPLGFEPQSRRDSRRFRRVPFSFLLKNHDTRMRLILLSCLAAMTWHSLPLAAADATFNSGSNGSYGPMNIVANTTLDLPPDGIFHCTTITVAQGATLTFRKNALNTPVYLLATGNVSIAGTIDVSGGAGAQGLAGEGGPGGFDGGAPAMNAESLPGDGFGPGAGRSGLHDTGDPSKTAGGGAYSTKSPEVGSRNSGERYGNAILIPLIGGSGGGGTSGNPGYGGGGGGGALLIASTSQIQITGFILAIGGGTPNYGWGTGVGGGSGGAIRLVAKSIFGSGTVSAYPVYPSAAGYGRIRVDCLTRKDWNFKFSGTLTYGKRMQVFPDVIPRLDILEAAGQSIPERANSGVSIQLASGASANQTVRIQARDFINAVPIRVMVTPENGPSAAFDTNIVMTTNPASVVVPVVIPPGGISRIHVWSR